MEMFFTDGGRFDYTGDGEYQVAYASWREAVLGVIPKGAKHLVVNTGECTVSFWSHERNLKTIKVVGLILEDGTELKV